MHTIETYDRVDDVTVILLEGRHSLSARNVGLLHNKLDVLLVETRLILILDNLCGGSRGLHGRAWCGHLRHLELGSGVLLRGCRQVLDLGLAKDNVGVRLRGLQHLGLGNDEQVVLVLLHGDARHAGHGLQAKLGKNLASLLLRTAVFHLGVVVDGGSGRGGGSGGSSCSGRVRSASGRGIGIARSGSRLL
jgi:hypothetical protein